MIAFIPYVLLNSEPYVKFSRVIPIPNTFSFPNAERLSQLAQFVQVRVAPGCTNLLFSPSSPSTLSRAIGELGRVAKTLYLLAYIDDETYRRRILTQLNRGEGRHSLARVTFHGQRGEVRQRYREGQEDQLGALGLVVNVLVLWNTSYMDAAIRHLRHQGYELKSEDIARLSPLGYKHINMLGRYQFALAEPLRRGELRPLRDPNDPNESDD